MRCPQCGEVLAVDPETNLKYCANCPWKEEKENPNQLSYEDEIKRLLELRGAIAEDNGDYLKAWLTDLASTS